MSLTIVEGPPDDFAEYAEVSIGFTVAEVFDESGIAALLAAAPAEPIPVPSPYWKDYDCHPGGRSTEWPASFDVSRWTVLAAFRGARRVGGAVVIGEAPDIDLLGDCSGCALVWDLRVAPDARAQGVGSALLQAAERRARECGALALRVETQQVNVPACRLYRSRGFRLERARRGAYPDLPHEVQLLWRKTLSL